MGITVLSTNQNLGQIGTSKQASGHQGRRGVAVNWETGTHIATQLFIKWAAKKTLLNTNGTESPAQSSVMAYMGKESEKERTYVHA